MTWFILIFLILYSGGGAITEDTQIFPSYIEGNPEAVFLSTTTEYTEIELKGLNNNILAQIEEFVRQNLDVIVDFKVYLIKQLLVDVGNLVKLIPTDETLIDNENRVYKKIVINFAEIITNIISSLHQVSKRTTDPGQFEGFKSIGKNNEYINLTSVIGCSSIVEYNKRKISCLKKFLKLVKQPVRLFLGSDLIYPMLVLIDLPISKINAQDQSELKVLMQIHENTNLIEYLRGKLVNPGAAYLKEKELIESKHETIVTPDQENYNQDINLPEVIHTTFIPETAIDLQSDSPNVGLNLPIETTENRNEISKLKTIDIKLANEIVENEADIASLKAELNNLKDSITVTNQNRDELLFLKSSDIKLATEIVENEADIASLKDSIVLTSQNKHELERLKEILTNFMNTNFTSADIRKNVWKKEIFRAGNEGLIQKITYLSQIENLNRIIPIPICTSGSCAYTIKPGFTRNLNKLLPSEKCQNKNNNVFCDVSKEENVCITKCKIVKMVPHTQEILLYNDKLFLYPFEYIELLGNSFETNISYFIQSEFNVSFTFKDKKYYLLENELVEGLNIDKKGEFKNQNWEHYLHIYKSYIIIAISSLSTFIGLISSIYFCKKRLDSRNLTRSVQINRTRVVFNRTPTN